MACSLSTVVVMHACTCLTKLYICTRNIRYSITCFFHNPFIISLLYSHTLVATFGLYSSEEEDEEGELMTAEMEERFAEVTVA